MKHSPLKIAKALLKLEHVDTLALSVFSDNKALIAMLKNKGLSYLPLMWEGEAMLFPKVHTTKTI